LHAERRIDQETQAYQAEYNKRPEILAMRREAAARRRAEAKAEAAKAARKVRRRTKA
jgi:hypothetical protein